MTDIPAPDAPPSAPAGTGWKRRVVVLLGGQTVSLFGSMLVQYAIVWHLTLLTQSGVVMMLSLLFGTVPQAIVSVFGGVWADRLNRRWLIVAADGTIAATTLALALIMLTGYQELWLIFLTMAIRSAGAGIQQPAVTALIPQLTPTEHLMRVNGIFQGIMSAMMLVAPPVAAAVYASWDIIGIFFIDVATAAIGIGILLTISVPTLRSADERPGYFTDLAAGLRYAFGHAFIRWLFVVTGVAFVLTVAPSVLTPLMVVRTFGDDVWLLTLNEIAFSVGMLAGGGLIAAWGGLRNRVLMIVLSGVAFGVLTLALGLSTNVWVFFGFMLLVGLAVPFFQTPATTLIQERVEPEYQGRVFGLWGVVMTLGMPIGMVVFGPLADAVSVEAILVWAGIAMIVFVAVAVLMPAGRKELRQGAE